MLELSKNGDLIFLHKMQPGAADKSYGIHVAKLAGMPHELLTRANQILIELEAAAGENQSPVTAPAATTPAQNAVQDKQLSLFVPEEKPEKTQPLQKKSFA